MGNLEAPWSSWTSTKSTQSSALEKRSSQSSAWPKISKVMCCWHPLISFVIVWQALKNVESRSLMIPCLLETGLLEVVTTRGDTSLRVPATTVMHWYALNTPFDNIWFQHVSSFLCCLTSDNRPAPFWPAPFPFESSISEPFLILRSTSTSLLAALWNSQPSRQLKEHCQEIHRWASWRNTVQSAAELFWNLLLLTPTQGSSHPKGSLNCSTERKQLQKPAWRSFHIGSIHSRPSNLSKKEIEQKHTETLNGA